MVRVTAVDHSLWYLQLQVGLSLRYFTVTSEIFVLE
jgi:hypothetical protein